MLPSMPLSSKWLWSHLLLLAVLTAGVCSHSNEVYRLDSPQLTASVGEHVIFDCPITFPRDIVMQYGLIWKKEGRHVFSWYRGTFTPEEDSYAGRITLVTADRAYGKGSVNLTNIRESDGGWYECITYFPNRTPTTMANGSWFHLTVLGGTLLAIPPVNVTTLEGQPARFPCVTKNNMATVTWYKDHVPLADLPDFRSRSSVDLDGSLTISKTNMLDSGEMMCAVVSPEGQRQTASAHLNVQYKAKVVFVPRDIYFNYGKTGMLDCHFRANPPLTNLRWEKDGYLFDPYNVAGVFYKNNGSLFFSQVAEDHRGKYTCTPFNELGTAGPSAAMIVNVLQPPMFTVTPQNFYLRKLGASLDMACDAVDVGSHRRPTIVWYRKDGVPLPLNRTRILNGNLSIEHVTIEDRGVYQCVASNEAATISSDTELRIEDGSPRALHNMTATPTTTSVRLQWLPGFIKPKMVYSIWYRAADTPEWRSTRLVPLAGNNEVTLSGLSPGRMYDLMVLTLDENEEGVFTKALRVKTTGSGGGREEVQENDTASAAHVKSPLSSYQQIGPPRNVHANLTLDGYQINWEAPEFGVDELRMYRVQWAAGPDEHYAGSSETTDTSILVTELEEDQTYYFQVSAVASNHYEAPSSQFVLHVPVFRNMRLLTVSLAVGVAFLLVAAAGAIYLKRMYAKQEAVKGDDLSNGPSV